MYNTSKIPAAAAKNLLQKTRAASAVALLVSLAACGGGGGGSGGGFAGFPAAQGTPAAPVADTPVTPAPVTFSGTAAAGIPLSGSVTVKDAKGATRTVPLSSNGGYTIDVTGMTAPFVFRAEGTVGGQRTVIYSAASAADVNGTINITPLTDLIVANIAGQIASKYFDSGDFSSLSASELKAESDALKAKLLPVLTAMGVDASIDLLRTAFTPLSSALDKALDVLRVSVDPVTNTATITNIVTQQSIVDDLAVKAAADAGAAPLPGDGLATAADDITLIRKALTDYVGKFANGAPVAAELTPLLANGSVAQGGYGFRLNDQSASDFINESLGDTNFVGASFSDIVINRINYAIDAVNNTAPRAYVEFTFRDKNGVAFSNNQAIQVVKGTDGVWRLRGDGRVLELNPHIHASRDVVSGCVTTGVEFLVQDHNTGNSGNVATVVVTGPGLPSNGLRLARPQVGGWWPIEGGISTSYELATNCPNVQSAELSDAAIAALPAVPEYTWTGLTSGGAVAQFSGFDIVYKTSFHARPFTLAEAVAAPYPVYGNSTPLSGYNGGSSFLVLASGLHPGFSAEFFLNISDGVNSANDQSDVAPSSAGTGTKTFNLPAVTATSRYQYVSTKDATWRDITAREMTFP